MNRSADAVLGPVDPQIGQYPAASILKAIAKKSPDRIKDETLILADQAEKALGQSATAFATCLSRNVRKRQTNWRDYFLRERGPTIILLPSKPCRVSGCQRDPISHRSFLI